MACRGLFFAWVLTFAASALAAEPAFTVITAECGVEQLVSRHYEQYPKWWLSGLHLVDLDADGDLDLFLSAHGAGKALALLNDGKGRFAVAPGNWPVSEIHLAYDADEDGRLDLTMTHGDGGGQWWRNRSRAGELDFQATGIIRGAARRQAMIDINADGKVDWLHGSGTAIYFNLGDGKGAFQQSAQGITFGPGGQAERLCLPVDIDSDGRIDLLSEWGHYSSPAGNSRIWHNDGHLQFTDVTKAAGLPESGLSIKGAGDVDQDGDLDLICIENKRLEIYLNDGKGRFTKKEGAFVGGEKGIAAPSWGVAVVTDFDNDGRSDIIVNGRNFLKLFRGTGDGRFVYVSATWGIKDTSAASVDDGLCFGDIDGDGDLDLVGYSAIWPHRDVAVYRNDLPAQHWVRIRPIGLPGNRGAAGAKIRIFAPGGQKLLWLEQVAIYDSQAAASYYAFPETERHFGLGQRTEVDVAVEFYPSAKTVWQRGVRANATVRVQETTE